MKNITFYFLQYFLCRCVSPSHPGTGKGEEFSNQGIVASVSSAGGGASNDGNTPNVGNTPKRGAPNDGAPDNRKTPKGLTSNNMNAPNDRPPSDGDDPNDEAPNDGFHAQRGHISREHLSGMETSTGPDGEDDGRCPGQRRDEAITEPWAVGGVLLTCLSVAGEALLADGSKAVRAKAVTCSLRILDAHGTGIRQEKQCHVTTAEVGGRFSSSRSTAARILSMVRSCAS